MFSDFLNIDESELHFGPQVDIRGEAYVVEDQLILHLDLIVPVVSICTICSGDAALTIDINNLYHIEDIKKLKTTIFDFSSVLRQEILLEVPRYAECRGGNCPDREAMKGYLVPKKSS